MIREDPASSFSAYRASVSRRRSVLALALAVLLCLTAVWRLAEGEWDIPLTRVAELLSPVLPENLRGTPEAMVVRLVRLPRFLAAVGAGGLLCVSGVVLQGLLANPLAEPYTLGVAAGAAFGGALGFILNSGMVMPFAFLGAQASLWLVGLIVWRGGERGSGARLILSGIIVNAFLSAGVTFLKAIADERLGPIVLWLMGSLAGAAPFSAAAVWAAALLILITAWIYGRQLDVLSLGEGRGTLLGVNERQMRIVLLYAASLGTAAAVSFFGIIGFVGLVVPHLLRLFIGPAHRPLLLLSFLAGGALLAVADGLAQYLSELPVGVITALLGGPFFCWLLTKKEGGGTAR